eukprot:SAG31_NODE_3668_length_4005_cov_1.850998_1_plen_384_part_00
MAAGKRHIAAPTLVRHLLAHGAPRAAARLDTDAAEVLPTPARSPPFFKLEPTDSLFVVADLESADAFNRAATAAMAGGHHIAFDAEWQPETRKNQEHGPSLVQVAICSFENAGSTVTRSDAAHRSVTIWILDVVQLHSQPRATALDALQKVLESTSCTKLGFGVQTDVNKLGLLFGDEFTGVHRVVDLRDSVPAPDGSSNRKGGPGLGAQMIRWCGCTLDKRWQCSDWTARPLRDEQLHYAAADAACLFSLRDALKSHDSKATCCEQTVVVSRPRHVTTTCVADAKAPPDLGFSGNPSDEDNSSSTTAEVTSDALRATSLDIMRKLVQTVASETCALQHRSENPNVQNTNLEAAQTYELNSLCVLAGAVPVSIRAARLRSVHP